MKEIGRKSYISNKSEDKILKKITRILLERNKNFLSLPISGDSVILLLSGGLDSISLWYLLMKKYGYNVYPIHVYSGKKDNQIKSIKKFSLIFKNLLSKKYHPVYYVKLSRIFSFKYLKDSGKLLNVLVDLPMILNNISYSTFKTDSVVGLTNNPARMGHYIYKAYEYGLLLRYDKRIHVNTIFVGIVPNDAVSLRDSTLTSLRSLNLSICLSLGDYSWRIIAPIERKTNFYYSKQSLIREALEDNIPLEKTWSCINNGRNHCGYCYNCLDRKKVFKKIGFIDQTTYQKNASIINRIVHRINKFKHNLLLSRKKTKKSLNFTKYKFTDKDLFILNLDIIFYKKNNILFFYNPRNGNIYNINESAQSIVKIMLEKPISFPLLMDKMIATYKVDKRKLKTDLRLFLLKHLNEGNILLIKENT